MTTRSSRSNKSVRSSVASITLWPPSVAAHGRQANKSHPEMFLCGAGVQLMLRRANRRLIGDTPHEIRGTRAKIQLLANVPDDS